MININKLKGKMTEKNYNSKKLCEKIGMDCSIFCQKLDSGLFSIREVDKISRALELNLKEACDIFFEQPVA